MSVHKKLERDPEHKLLVGVCSGVALYFKLDPVLIRGIFVLLALLHGSGIVLYIILAFVMPVKK